MKLSFLIKQILIIFLITKTTQAHTNKSFYLGLGYHSESSLYKITQSQTGAKSMLGSTTYPLLLKYDMIIPGNYFFTPKLAYTLLSRNGSGSTIKSTFWHLMLPFGQNFTGSSWDWAMGLGVFNRTIQGAGGTTEQNNGTSTTTFAIPGRSSTSQTVTFNFLFSRKIQQHSINLDLITEGLLSADKRTFDLMLGYLYQFN
jgi:hypothetical protein